MENLYTYLKSITVLSEQGQSALKEILKVRYFKKGEYLLEAGEVSNSFFYVERGYCRVYYQFGAETINTNFYFENEFATNIRSMKLGSQSEFAIQAEEDMKVIVFDKEKLYDLYSRSVEIDAMGRKLMEQIVGRQEEQANLFKLNTAKERYDYMCEIQPQIVKRIPLNHIASYLGMSMDTLTSIYKSEI